MLFLNVHTHTTPHTQGHLWNVVIMVPVIRRGTGKLGTEEEGDLLFIPSYLLNFLPCACITDFKNIFIFKLKAEREIHQP